MDSSSCGARAYMLDARFGVRAAEDGHLTLLRAHAAVVHVLAQPSGNKTKKMSTVGE
jgi:hypothetical protein